MVSDTALNVILAVASLVVSSAIGYYFFVRAQREPRPVYVVTGNTVVRAHAERKIQVRYRDKDVPIVTRSVIAFWNAGRQPIRRADIVENHPLTVVLPEGADVLEAQVVARTRPDIDFLVMWGRPESMPDGTVRIKTHFDFSFLNYRDGGTLEVLHTGDDPFAVTIEGTIVGVDGPPLLIQQPLPNPIRSLWLPLVGVFLFFIALGYFLGAAGLPRWSGWLLAIAVAFGSVLFVRAKGRRQVPTALRRSFESLYRPWERGAVG